MNSSNQTSNVVTTKLSCISVEGFKELSQASFENAIVLDLGQAQTYARGHLPQAVHVPVARIVRQEGYAPGLLPHRENLIALAQAYGLGSGKTVYLYDDEGGGWAGRMAWILDILQIQQVVYIDGGLRAWLAAGFPLETVKNAPCEGPAPKEFNFWPSVTCDELVALLEQDSVDIVDARSRAEYDGLRQFAQRAGHIPGAVNYEWTVAMAIEKGSRIREIEDIREELVTLGVSGDKDVLVYCQTHHRSGFSYMLFRLLGFSVRAYAGSWSEWGNKFDVPVEEGNTQ